MKTKFIFHVFCSFILTIVFYGCKEKDTVPTVSNTALIHSFKVDNTQASINESMRTITLVLPATYEKETVSPVVSLNPKVQSANPSLGSSIYFEGKEPIDYPIINEEGRQIHYKLFIIKTSPLILNLMPSYTLEKGKDMAVEIKNVGTLLNDGQHPIKIIFLDKTGNSKAVAGLQKDSVFNRYFLSNVELTKLQLMADIYSVKIDYNGRTTAPSNFEVKLGEKGYYFLVNKLSKDEFELIGNNFRPDRTYRMELKNDFRETIIVQGEYKGQTTLYFKKPDLSNNKDIYWASTYENSVALEASNNNSFARPYTGLMGGIISSINSVDSYSSKLTYKAGEEIKLKADFYSKDLMLAFEEINGGKKYSVKINYDATSLGFEPPFSGAGTLPNDLPQGKYVIRFDNLKESSVRFPKIVTIE